VAETAVPPVDTDIIGGPDCGVCGTTSVVGSPADADNGKVPPFRVGSDGTEVPSGVDVSEDVSEEVCDVDPSAEVCDVDPSEEVCVLVIICLDGETGVPVLPNVGDVDGTTSPDEPDGVDGTPLGLPVDPVVGV